MPAIQSPLSVKSISADGLANKKRGSLQKTTMNRSADMVLTSDSSSQSEGSSNDSFPETLEAFRENARKTNDPLVQLAFVRFLFETGRKATEDFGSLGINFEGIGDKMTEEERKMHLRNTIDAEGLKWLKKLATQGSAIGRQPLAEAQFLLAEFYGTGGCGLPVDHSKAFGLYLQASKQSHASASYRAGVCYEVGAGTKRDSERAIQFYRKSAAFGDGLAMHKLGLILLYGKLNQRKNHKEGLVWLKRASDKASAAHPEPIHDLAQCYEKHGGCPVVIADDSYAFSLYSRAAHLGYAPSQYRLGTVYEFGVLGCAPDAALSIQWYGRAAEQGFAEAELALAHWYQSGAAGILRQSDADAHLWARKAADRSNTKAEHLVGQYYETGIGVPIDVNEAKRWYAKAAAKGYKRSIQRLQEIKKMHARRTKNLCIIS